jgi:glutamate dehydrogenase (NAD(P)+)
VAVSYLEWIQNRRAETWSFSDVMERLDRMMRHAYACVWEVVRDRRLDPRTAAIGLGLNRIRKVYEDRGVFP